MKVLIVSQIFGDGYVRGAERVATDIATWLSKRHDVEILSLGDVAGQEFNDGLRINRLPFTFAPRPSAHSLGLSAVGKIIWHARNAWGGVSMTDLRACIDVIQPDVVYAHKPNAFMPQIFRICRDEQVPFVVHLHDYSTLCPRTTMYKSERNCVKPCLSCSALTASWRQHSDIVGHAIAVSAFVRDRHRQFGAYPKARWHVVHNSDHGTLKSYARKSDGPFTFGFIGAITPQKGFSDLVNAFCALPKQAEARLVIAGTGAETYVAEAKEKLAGHRVEWLGQVAPNEFYSRVDCVIVPSRWHEPQALVLVEAMRRGLLIIGSERGGTAEVIGPRQGHSLYDPNNPKALTDAMVAIQQSLPNVTVEDLNPEFFMMVEKILIESLN